MRGLLPWLAALALASRRVRPQSLAWLLVVSLGLSLLQPLGDLDNRRAGQMVQGFLLLAALGSLGLASPFPVGQRTGWWLTLVGLVEAWLILPLTRLPELGQSLLPPRLDPFIPLCGDARFGPLAAQAGLALLVARLSPNGALASLLLLSLPGSLTALQNGTLPSFVSLPLLVMLSFVPRAFGPVCLTLAGFAWLRPGPGSDLLVSTLAVAWCASLAQPRVPVTTTLSR